MSGPTADVDLTALWRQLREKTAVDLELLGRQFALDLVDEPSVERFAYPVLEFAPPRQLKIAADSPVEGRLVGVIGAYLLFDRGVFNVRAHASHDVALVRIDALPPPDRRIRWSFSDE
ncbi:MAG: DUF2797 domain-containing protein [Gammaproteobacteria bacterium]|nr:DUF2797 domain-containing protein [Gammaproteobacteria bacterium]